MATGRLALDRHQQRRPHALMSFTRLARLLQLAMDFGLLACGQPAPPELSFEDRYANCMADLERAYGPASPPSADTENPAVSPDSPVKPPSLQTKPVGRESSRAVPNSQADPMGPAGSQAGSVTDLRQQPPAPSPTTTSQPSPPASGPAPAAWPPPDDKQDLIPHALVVGPHGLLCLQRLEPHQPR
jgi:hypothetical protein